MALNMMFIRLEYLPLNNLTMKKFGKLHYRLRQIRDGETLLYDKVFQCYRREKILKACVTYILKEQSLKENIEKVYII